MKNLYLTAAAVIITTSLASNLFWVAAFGTAVPGVRGRLRSALGELVYGLRDLVDGWVAGLMARSVRQPTRFRLDDLSDRGPRDIGHRRGNVGPVCSEPDGHFGAGGQQSQLGSRSATEARPR